MEASFILIFTAILFSFIFGGESTSFTIKNNCPYTIWPAASTSGTSAPIGNTGFSLDQGASKTIRAPANWIGRFWARTFCTTDSSGRFSCPIGDCGSGQIPCKGNNGAPPITLVELSLNVVGNQDFYDISLVDGFNLPVAVTPRGGGCQSTTCPGDTNAACPSELAVRYSNGAVIGCKTACLTFKTDAYCCTGSYSTAATCPPSDFSKFFKLECPQAYSYSYDDTDTTFACPSGGDYLITFCP